MRCEKNSNFVNSGQISVIINTLNIYTYYSTHKFTVYGVTEEIQK